MNRGVAQVNDRRMTRPAHFGNACEMKNRIGVLANERAGMTNAVQKARLIHVRSIEIHSCKHSHII